MADFSKLYSAGNTNEGATDRLYEGYKVARKRRTALLASTRLGAASTFRPDNIAQTYGLVDEYAGATGKKLDPKYVDDATRPSLQLEIDKRKIARITNDSENIANWLTDSGNMELSYDDLGTVSELGSIINRVGSGFDSTIDEANYGFRFDLNLEQMRQLSNSDKSFQEIYEANVEAGRMERDASVVPDILPPVLTEAVDTVVDYGVSRLSRLFRGEEDQAEAFKGAADDAVELLETIDNETIKRAEDFRGSKTFEERQNAFAALPEAKTAGESIQNIIAFAGDRPVATAWWGMQVAAESMPGIAAAALTQWITKNAKASATVMGVNSAVRSRGGAFQELITNNGYDISTNEGRLALMADPNLPRLFRNQAATYGAVVGIMDAMSAGAASQFAVKSVAGDFFLQMTTQAVMGSGGELFGRLAANMPVDWNEVMLEGFIEMVTGPLEVVSTGGKFGVRKATNKARQVNGVNQRRKFFEALGTASKDSKLRKRAPKKFEQLINSATKDGPVEDIYINPDDMDEMFQTAGTTADEFFTAMPQLSRDAYEAARTNGTDFKIPTGVYAAHVVGSSLEDTLAQHIRFGPMEMSMAEAQNLAKSIKDSTTDIELDVEAVSAAVDQLSTEAQGLFEGMTAQISASGTVTPQAAAQQALPMAQFLDVRAARSGTPIAEMAAKYGAVDIRAFENQAAARRRSTVAPLDVAAIFDAVVAPAEDAAPAGSSIPNVAAVRRRLDAKGITEPTIDDVHAAVLQAAADGEIVGELDDDALLTPTSLNPDGEELMQTVSLRDGEEDLSEWGLDTPSLTRDLAVKLQKRQRKKYGKTNRNTRGPKTVAKFGNWMADEIMFELQAPDASAKGWYGEKFQNALNIMGEVFPELVDQQALENRNRPIPGVETVADVRALMTMILAITSNGQKVADNYRLATLIYKALRVDGDFSNAMPKALRGGDMALKLSRMAALAKEQGGYELARQYLLQEMTVSEMNKQRKAEGESKVTGMPADMIVPRAAVIFGPKLGAFYANLSGATGYLTMDMWWTRTVNRFRGDLIPKVVGLKGNELNSSGEPQGLHRFKVLINRPDLTDSQAINYVTEYAQRAKDKKYKNTTLAEKAGNTLFKAIFKELNEQPYGPSDRAFMYKVAIAAQQEIEKRTGEPISIADVQAIIWYYEKRLYSDMGVRDSGDISYEEAARRAVDLEGSTQSDEFFQSPTDIRDDVVDGTELVGDGRKFADFFGAVTSGERQQADLTNYEPPIALPPEVAPITERREQLGGNFDDHIKASIPGYSEMQDGVNYALAQVLGDGAVLRIGGSEGSAIKSLVEAAGPGATGVSMDPNVEMQKSFENAEQVDGVRFDLSAFSDAANEGKTLWTEDDGTEITGFAPEGKFDVVVEQMVFQFIDKGRGAQIKRVKEMMNDGGLFYTAEKVGGPAEQFNANEAKKDEFKAKHFSQEELAAKAAEVLQTGEDAVEGMTGLQASQAELERVLLANFEHVVQVWDSGNFKGYIATDDRAKLDAFLEALPSLDSEYATVVTPRDVRSDRVEEGPADTFYQDGKVASLAEFSEFPLEAFQSDGWFIVSPNTAAVPERQAEMRAKLEALGLTQYQELQGMYEGEPDGTTFLVIGPRWQGLALGREFGQESVLTSRGLEYTDGSNTPTVPFDGVLTEDAAIASSNHSIRLSDGKAFSLNLLWPEPIVPGMADGKYYGVKLEADGTMKVTHWSDEHLTVIDPELAGTGPLKGEERKRRQVKGSFYGLNIGLPNGYTKEMLGPYRHEAFVDPTSLYPFYEDPDNLKAKIGSDVPDAQKVGAYEELIRDAGYDGYFTTQGQPGMVAKVFVPLEAASVAGETEFYQGEDMPTFKSALAEGIANAKQPRASAKDWLAIIGKMPGVRASERWFTGVDAFLESQMEENPKQQITREQLYEWVSANRMEIETLVDSSNNGDDPAFASYVEPGSYSEYQVVKLTVPNLDEAGPNKAYDVRPFVERMHFRDPNIVVHARVTTRDGVFFIEEVQSDLNNRWRKSGIDMPGPAELGGDTEAELWVKYREAQDAADAAQDEFVNARREAKELFRSVLGRSLRLSHMTAIEEARVSHEMGTRERALLNDVKDFLADILRDEGQLITILDEGMVFMGSRMALSRGEKVHRLYRFALLKAMTRAAGNSTGELVDLVEIMGPAFTSLNESNKQPVTGSALVDEWLDVSDRVVDAETRLDAANDVARAAYDATEAGETIPAPITPFADAAAIELAMKQLLRMAADDPEVTAVAWTPGVMQGRRWQQQVGEVQHSVQDGRWDTHSSGDTRFKTVELEMVNGQYISLQTSTKTGKVESSSLEQLKDKPLSEVVGDTMAARILEESTGEFVGTDMVFKTVSGEGYINVYDRQIKKFVEKFAKKNGGSLTVNDDVLHKQIEGKDRRLLEDQAKDMIADQFSLPYGPPSLWYDSVRSKLQSSRRDYRALSGGVYGEGSFTEIATPRMVGSQDDAAYGRGDISLTNANIILTTLDMHRSVSDAGYAANFTEAAREVISDDSWVAAAQGVARKRAELSVSRQLRNVRELHDRIDARVDGFRELENLYDDPEKKAQAAAVYKTMLNDLPANKVMLERLTAKLEDPATLGGLTFAGFFKNVMDRLTLEELAVLSGEPDKLVPKASGEPVWYAEITPQMRASAKQPWTMFQGRKTGPFGSIILPPPTDGGGPVQINLFENANLSTLLHEGGHYFLWVLQSMAVNGDESAKAEIAALTNWWMRNAEAVAKDGGVGAAVVRKFLREGTTGDPDLDRKVNKGMHEQFARGYEAYLMEGKAPSNILRAAFESFSAWLLERYKSVANLNVQLDDEVRGVFERLLATDEQLENARIDNNIDSEIAQTAKEMGLDEESYAQLVKLGTEARDEAKQMALKDVMAPIFRERKAEVKARRKLLTEQVTEEVMSKKSNRVIQWLGNGRWIGGTAPENIEGLDLRMDTEMLREEYPDIDIEKLPRGSRPLHVRGSLVQADEVAEWFGYSSGDAMLNDLATAPKPQVEIKNRVDAQIKAEFGDSLTDGTLQQQAVDALHGDKRGQVIVAELRALNRMSAGKNKMTSKQQARAMARSMISRMQVRAALKSHDFLGAERRYAERASRELAAGNLDAAFEAKRKQLINYALYSESRLVVDEVGKTERLTGRLKKRSTRQSLAGEYLGAIDDVLERYDFRKVSANAERRQQGLAEYIDMMKRQKRDNELAIPEHVLAQTKRVPYKTLTVQQLRGVRDTLVNIEHTARFKQKLRDAKEAREMDVVVNDITTAFKDNIKGKQAKRFPTGTSRAIDATKEYVNLVFNADTILRRIDGWTQGKVITHLKRAIDEAGIVALRMREQAAEDFENLYSPYSRYERSQMAIKRERTGVEESMSKWDIISVALNTGNENNYERLVSKDAAASFTPEQVASLLETLDDRDWRFVQATWDYIDTYWALIKEREERTTGVAPEKVEAFMQVEAPAGVRGGYYPIKYDANLSSKVAEEAEADLFTNMQGGRFGKAQTRNGHTKERAKTGGGRTLQLGMHVMHGHVQSVIHDLAFSEAVNNTWKILQDGRVRGQFEANGMLADYHSLEAWVQDVANGQIAGGGVLGSMARRAKAGFTISKLAFNMSTVAVQLTGAAQSMALIGSADMAIGYSKYLSGGMFKQAALIKARSPFMAEREDTFQRDIYDMLSETSSGPLEARSKQARDLMMKAGFYLMQKFQFYGVDAPTWIAAYDKALKNGKSDAEAAYEADRMVARAQGSGLFADRSAIERGTTTSSQRQNDFIRLFTALGSYMFAKFNVATEIVGRTDATPQSVFKAVSDLILLYSVEAIAYGLIKGALPGMGDGDDDDEGWMSFLARETALSALGGLPFVRDLAGPLQGFGGGGSYGNVLETIGDGASGITKGLAALLGIAEDELTASDWRNIIDFVGLSIPGVPSTAINRVLKVEDARASGTEVGPVNYIMGLPQ